MTKLAYFECPTGIAGDMCLGALLNLGVPFSFLQDYFRRLDIEQEFKLQVSSVHRKSQQATYVRVELEADKSERSSDHQHGHAHHRHLPEIERLILAADLPKRAETWSLEIFRNLAIAEGKVHGIEPHRVHFHEVGATDAIVDIVGTCLGLHWLGVEEIFCSALPTGGGTVKAAHGQLPVPVPAVLQLWQTRQVPVYDNGIHKELVTPTGAAIATTLAQTFGPPPPMSLHQIGLGAGTADLPLPNILRIWLGELTAASPSSATHPDQVVMLETQIDDLNPQAFGYIFEALFKAGALDVFTQAVGMKKSRPGILLTVISKVESVDACETVIFKETSTLGIRRSQQQRTTLQRVMKTVDTRYGPVQIKLAYHHQQLVNVQPEYDDCAKIAKALELPWQHVHRTALAAWYQSSSPEFKA